MSEHLTLQDDLATVLDELPESAQVLAAFDRIEARLTELELERDGLREAALNMVQALRSEFGVAVLEEAPEPDQVDLAYRRLRAALTPAYRHEGAVR